jgi:hypothetical protein
MFTRPYLRARISNVENKALRMTCLRLNVSETSIMAQECGVLPLFHKRNRDKIEINMRTRQKVDDSAPTSEHNPSSSSLALVHWPYCASCEMYSTETQGQARVKWGQTGSEQGLGCTLKKMSTLTNSPDAANKLVESEVDVDALFRA